jgi:outer membrane protein OmpA-like peptidoglycan-associated protein/tetratricopeptide (TPR) repeat protein
MIKNTLVAILLLISSFAFAQRDVEFSKANFSNDKAGLKIAIKNIEDGDYYFNLGRSNIEIALDYYLRANHFNPNNSELNYKIGLCYLEAKPAKEGIKYFLKAKKLNDKVDEEYYLYLAKAYHLDLQFDTAIKYYKYYKDNLPPSKASQLEDIELSIEECKNGKELVKKPVRVFIENLGSTINGEYPDYGAVVNMDESMIFFTSRRPTTTGGNRNPLDMMYFEDAYWSIKRSKIWLPAKNIGKPINTVGHDAVVGIAPDGQTLLLYRDDNSGDIYWSKQKGDNWTRPNAFPEPINSKYQESSAAFSYNGNRIFFVSNRPGGYGGKDIYYCDRAKNGKWGKAVNLGNTINTSFDEIAVFVQADGKTIYFSSEGHYGMGSFDIFKSVYENGKWSKPENLGYPINSPDPDVFFSIGASGRNAYFSSNREEGMGDQDIYKITFLGAEKKPVFSTEDPLIASNSMGFKEADIENKISMQTSQLTLLKGIVTDEITEKPLEATIELIDNEENEVLATFNSNSASGKYLISLPSGHNYGLSISAEGYLFYSANFIIPKAESYKEVVRNVQLQRIEIGKGIALKNIFFEYKKANLNKESKMELNRLVNLMKKYPTLRLEISGHTDNVGDEEYNQKLSLLRANAVVGYLVKNGIQSDRLVAKGYGFSQPIATNDTEEGRQQNRRSEIKIIGK